MTTVESIIEIQPIVQVEQDIGHDKIHELFGENPYNHKGLMDCVSAMLKRDYGMRLLPISTFLRAYSTQENLEKLVGVPIVLDGDSGTDWTYAQPPAIPYPLNRVIRIWPERTVGPA